MAIELLYFAWVREAIGCDGERIEPPAGARDVAALLDWLATQGEGYAEAFADRARLRCAIDQRFAPLDAPIEGATEIALFPPVTGG